MANIKTAISIDEGLFKQAERVGKEMKVSRSRLFATALKDFIERRQNQTLLEKINAAHADSPNSVDRRYLRQMRKKHRSLIEQW